MEKPTSEIVLNDPVDGERRITRTMVGSAGTDSHDREVYVSVDVEESDPAPYVLLSVDGISGDGDDGIVDLEESDDVRTLAAKLLEAADALDAMTGKASA